MRCCCRWKSGASKRLKRVCAPPQATACLPLPLPSPPPLSLPVCLILLTGPPLHPARIRGSSGRPSLCFSVSMGTPQQLGMENLEHKAVSGSVWERGDLL